MLRNAEIQSRSRGILTDIRFVLWCLTQTTLQLYRGALFYCCRKSDCPGKTTKLPQVTDNRYHIKCYRLHLTICGIRTHNVTGTECTCNCKSNSHTVYIGQEDLIYQNVTLQSTYSIELIFQINCHYRNAEINYTVSYRYYIQYRFFLL